MKSKPHDEAMAELYRDDPAFALGVINSILEDGDQAELLIGLRQMAQAFGGVQAVAEQARSALPHAFTKRQSCARQSLSYSQSDGGLRLAVQPLAASVHV